MPPVVLPPNLLPGAPKPVVPICPVALLGGGNFVTRQGPLAEPSWASLLVLWMQGPCLTLFLLFCWASAPGGCRASATAALTVKQKRIMRGSAMVQGPEWFNSEHAL